MLLCCNQYMLKVTNISTTETHPFVQDHPGRVSESDIQNWLSENLMDIGEYRDNI